MRIKERIKTLFYKASIGKPHDAADEPASGATRSRRRPRSTPQVADADKLLPAPPKASGKDRGSPLLEALVPRRGVSSSVHVAGPGEPAARLAEPTYRVSFEHTLLEPRMCSVIEPADLHNYKEVAVVALGQGKLRTLPLQQALEVTRSNYHLFKRTILDEARDRGLDLRRLAFDDVAHTVEMEHGIFEMAALFPKTFGAFAPKLVETPHDLVETLSVPWLHKVPKDGGGMAPRAYVARARAALENAKRPRPQGALTGPTVNRLVRQAYRNSRGLVVGESHREAAPRNFLIQAMPTLKAEGVTTLYMEHVTSSLQGVLDRYARAKPGSPLPPDLAAYMAARDDNLTTPIPFGNAPQATAVHAPLAKVIEAAQAHGIRVVAIETDESYASSFHSYASATALRMLGMNYEALLKIQQQSQGKWVALTGSAHVHTAHIQHPAARTEKVPGLAEVTGAMALTVEDGQGTSAVLFNGQTRQGRDLEARLEHRLLLPPAFDDETPVSIGS